MKRTALSVILMLAGLAPLHAADLVPAPAEPAPPPALYIGPTFAFTGYFWASALSGKSSTLPPLPPAKIDLTFGDIFKDLNGGIMGAGEFKVDRWIVLTDVMFSKVTSTAKLPGLFFSEAELRTESLTLQGDAMYRLFTNQTVDFDLGAGVRYWNLDNKLTLKSGALAPRIDHSEAEDWFDPVVAARIIAHINDTWSVTVLGDIGGFNAGSKLTYQVVGLLNYKWNENVTLHAGYRLLSVDYKNGSFLYDVRMYGPLVALTYKF
ncbi:hypothetical protein ACMDCR_03090 [Labrys okinawensis]|uniref:hypothetical protein n=1 Tax=Labrys okinawensis TaxID=346911 RepID=UPI0039BC4C7C